MQMPGVTWWCNQPRCCWPCVIEGLQLLLHPSLFSFHV